MALDRNTITKYGPKSHNIHVHLIHILLQEIKCPFDQNLFPKHFTGVFDDSQYFNVMAEYCKASPNDIRGLFNNYVD